MNEQIKSLDLARKIRVDVLEMIHKSRGSHVGSIFSCADILAVLYSEVLNITPQTVHDKDRDIFIMSKGHAGAGLYAVLAEKGFIPKELLDTHYANGSFLSGHISHKNLAGVELSTGSLGHGCCVGAGMALAKKKSGAKGRVYVLLGDGECEEGSVWEMALFAKRYELDNLTIIIDHNKLQGLDFCDEVLGLTHLKEKWLAFGWDVSEIDGHNHDLLKKNLRCVTPNKPTCIVAHTIKGKGVSFMENDILWHYRDPQGELYEQAREELGKE